MSIARTWWRLRRAEWLDALRTRPLRGSLALLLWWGPWVLLPVASWFSAPLAAGFTDLLLSVDVPLVLLLGAATTFGALRARERVHMDDWLWPAQAKSRPLQWMRWLGWLAAARWPAGLVIAAALLRLGMTGREARSTTAELCLMGALALAGGWAVAWLLGTPSARIVHAHGVRRARGLAALSWAPLHEVRSRLALRRLPLLLAPAMLAAPLGAHFRQALAVLVVFLAALIVATGSREAWRVQSITRGWLRDTTMPGHRIAFWTWRHVAVGIVALTAAFLLWPMPERIAGPAP